jgi:orotidine-5'-phosphate decarboxylase
MKDPLHLEDSFATRLAHSVQKLGNPIVVGLDPNLEFIPQTFFEQSTRSVGVERFCFAVIDAIAGLVPVVKIQSAYFEVLGGDGVHAMARVATRAAERGLLVIVDAKRGDIGSTSRAYADAFLGPDAFIKCDAMTLNPYLGWDSLAPFFSAALTNRKGVFVCAQTSNPGARDLQSAVMNGKPVYQLVAEHVARADDSAEPSLGLVVGATFPETAEALRSLGARCWFLVPGIGVQGADLRMYHRFLRPDGLGALLASSRALTFPERFGNAPSWSAEAVRTATLELIGAVRSNGVTTAG